MWTRSTFSLKDTLYVRYGDQPMTDAHKYGAGDPGFFKVGGRLPKCTRVPGAAGSSAAAGPPTRPDSEGLQEFVNGRMFWASESDTIYIIYRATTTSARRQLHWEQVGPASRISLSGGSSSQSSEFRWALRLTKSNEEQCSSALLIIVGTKDQVFS
jgi:hypothetical protein